VGLAAEDYSAFYEWLAPVTGRISSGTGLRDNPVTGNREFHDGVDIAIPVGTPIVAPRDGYVLAAGFSPSFGSFLRVAHDEYITFYAHLSRIMVAAGDAVTRGQRIAYSGNTGQSTGPHLPFGMFRSGQFIDPVVYMDFSS